MQQDHVRANDDLRIRIGRKLQNFREETLNIEFLEDVSNQDYTDSLETDYGYEVKDEDPKVYVSPWMEIPSGSKRSKSKVLQMKHCNLCNMLFPKYVGDKTNKQLSFHEHIVQTHCMKRGSNFECKHCEAKYNRLNNMRRHLKEKHLESKKELPCRYCPQTFHMQSLLLTHLRSVHNSLTFRYTCDICGKDFPSKGNIRRHILTHLKQFVCRTCNASFDERTEYKNHRKSCGEKYTCHTCSKVLFTKETLEQHIIRKHMQSPPCDICGKEFTCQTDLDRHKNLTHASKTKICEHCGKSFFTENGLKFHVKYTHLKIENEYTKRRFWCELCQRYESHTTKSEHKLREKYGQRYKCDKCDMAFFSNQRLQRHSHVHTKTRPFNCKLCEKGYYNTAYLKAHYERIHGSEYLGAIKK